MQTLPIEETITALGGSKRATEGVNRVANRWHENDGDGGEGEDGGAAGERQWVALAEVSRSRSSQAR